MTGEIFAATRHCQSFSFLSNDFVFDKGAFLDAVAVSQSRGGLLHHLFSIRARAVLKPASSKPDASYLLGLLIGSEIKSGLEVYPDASNILLIGSDVTVRDYQIAFSISRH